ncbi:MULTISPECIES: hypothetical protein [Burkholderia]|uniref:Uncharacterized protein n=1 Tax=Burkholderia anthina TaxID=179879 RepID=A0A7T6VIS6_9BURK|nr:MULTISPECIES: hypothetical protein [Burkholderia]MBY4868266.1 hypothetical protein [Burkholderia anthina]QQK04640.1 hypothetical protein JFN94_25230 [Burkholderia anthina]
MRANARAASVRGEDAKRYRRVPEGTRLRAARRLEACGQLRPDSWSNLRWSTALRISAWASSAKAGVMPRTTPGNRRRPDFATQVEFLRRSERERFLLDPIAPDRSSMRRRRRRARIAYRASPAFPKYARIGNHALLITAQVPPIHIVAIVDPHVTGTDTGSG